MRSRNYNQNEVIHYLAKYLSEATKKIHLAIGWLNDDGLFALLQKQAMSGVEVVLILLEEDDQNLAWKTPQKGILQKGNYRGVKVITVEEAYKERFIDHRFGIIDDAIVLTGSYDWGLSGSSKDAALTITKQVPSLAQGFEVEFNRLSTLKPSAKRTKKVVNPTIELLKKLEVIKTLVGIGDTDFLYLRLRGLKKYLPDENVALIHETLRNKLYEEAISFIKKFTNYHQYFQACIEPPIDNFRREIQQLEDEIANISNEFSETEKLLHQFSVDHTATLGDLLQKILFQSKVKAEIEQETRGDQKAFEEAKNDYEEYTKTHEAAKKQKQKVLSRQEQKELKKLYRQSSLRCHPDKVVEELHAQAEEIFIELNQAYKANDLERLRAINQQLKSGRMLSKSEGITTLKKLESSYNNLNQKLKDWQEKLATLQQMPSYKTISSIDDWEVYFEETRVILEAQLNRLILHNEAHLKPSL